MENQFIPVPGYETLYSVGPDGTVRNAKGSTVTARVSRWGGYLTVNLSRRGKDSTCLVHRLVAVSFVPNPQNMPIVNHLDGNRLNNHRDNLSWTDHSGNIQHAYDHGLIPGNTGGNHRRAQAILCEETGEVFGTIKDAARSAGRNYRTFCSRLNRGKGRPYWRISES